MFIHSHYVASLSESSFYSSISPACLIKKKKKKKPQNYPLVSPGNCLGLPGFFKTFFFFLSFFHHEENQKYIQCSVRFSFCGECESLKGKAVAVLLCDILLGDIHPVMVMKWSFSFCGFSFFLAVFNHLPVWDYFYTLFLSSLILGCSRRTRSHRIAWSSAAPFQLIPKRFLGQLNCFVASFISYWTSISLTSVGAGANLNWTWWRWIGIDSSCIL